jgi:hypothetical protein
MMVTLDAEMCPETLVDNNKESALAGTVYIYHQILSTKLLQNFTKHTNPLQSFIDDKRDKTVNILCSFNK